jgi:hypothetical protein
MQDADVLANAKQQIDGTGYTDLKSVRISIEKEVDVQFPKTQLVLRGTVRSFYLKQVAQSAIRTGINGYEIKNLLEVTSRIPKE